MRNTLHRLAAKPQIPTSAKISLFSSLDLLQTELGYTCFRMFELSHFTFLKVSSRFLPLAVRSVRTFAHSLHFSFVDHQIFLESGMLLILIHQNLMNQ